MFSRFDPRKEAQGKQKNKPFRIYQTEEEWMEDVNQAINTFLYNQQQGLQEDGMEEGDFQDEGTRGGNLQGGNTRKGNSRKGNSQGGNPQGGNLQGDMSERGSSRKGGSQKEKMRADIYTQMEYLERAGVNPGQLMEDQEFMDLIDKGEGIIGAYIKLLEKRTIKRVYDNINNKQKRIVENGLGRSNGAMTKADPAKMSDEEFKKLMERVRKGDTIHE